MSDPFDTDMTAGETATFYTDQFVDAGIAKFDAVFGAGFTKENPALLIGYLATSAANLQSFMTAATSAENEFLDNLAMAMAEDAESDLAPPKPTKKKRGR